MTAPGTQAKTATSGSTPGRSTKLRNPTGSSPLTDDQLRDGICEMLDGGIGQYLRLYPACYTPDEALLPMLGSWKGDNEVTSDPEVAAKLWRQYSGAVVACRCDHLVVFDVDLLPGEAGPRTLPNPWLDNLTDEQNEAMNDGLVAVTASGACHFIFRQRDGKTIGSSSPAPGVDVKAGRGASVVLPPSFVRKPKKGYEGCHQWQDDRYNFEAPPVLPAVLADLLDTLSPGNGTGKKDRDSSTYTEAKIPQGERNKFLRDRAWHLRGQGLKRQELIGAILAVNEDQCVPPLPEREAHGLAQSAFEKKSPDRREVNPLTVVGENGPPQIVVNDRPLRDIYSDAWSAVIAANVPPAVFNTAGHMSYLKNVGQDLIIEMHNKEAAFSLLARVADWIKTGTNSNRHVKPVKEVADELITNPHPALPELEAVIHTPVYGNSWQLISEPGYHPEAHIWLYQEDDTDPFSVPDSPSEADVKAALSLILDDLLIDFPFAANSDRAHAIAAILLPFVRRMFTGPTPIHLIEAPVPGTGKSLLAELIAIIALGVIPGVTTLTRNEEETRKKLTAILSRGTSVISIDNQEGGLSSAQVSAAITAEYWEDRILGKTQMVRYPNQALWMVSGNNPNLSMEIARRCVRIRLDAGEERPWDRTEFKHQNIREWTKQNRNSLVQAILTLIRHWIVSGGPVSHQTLGSFENWSRIIGGMVGHFGLSGFLEDAEEFYENADPESGEWSAFISKWWDTHKDTYVPAKDLLELAMQHDMVGFAYAAKSESGMRIRFGKQLGRLRDRRFGDYRVVVGMESHKKVKAFRLVSVEKGLFS